MSKQWKLVPVDPTSEMEEAFAYSFFGGWSPEADPITDALKAMIEVVPAAPAFGDAIALSESTRDDLQELINGATQCEEADVDYEFANEIGQLLDPVYSNAYVLQLQAEIQRLKKFETAVKVWDEKTEWVLKSAETQDLGRHRADVLRSRIDALSQQLSAEKNQHHSTALARDIAEAMADELAKAIGERFRVDVGEHSSMNCPWGMAIGILRGEYKTDSDEARERDALQSDMAKARGLVRWFYTHANVRQVGTAVMDSAREFIDRQPAPVARAADAETATCAKSQVVAQSVQSQGIEGTSFQRLNQLANEGE